MTIRQLSEGTINRIAAGAAFSLLAASLSVESPARAAGNTLESAVVDAFATLCIEATPDLRGSLERAAADGHWRQLETDENFRSLEWSGDWHSAKMTFIFFEAAHDRQGCGIAANGADRKEIKTALDRRLALSEQPRSDHPVPADLWSTAVNGYVLQVALVDPQQDDSIPLTLSATTGWPAPAAP